MHLLSRGLWLAKYLGRMEHMEFALMQKVDHMCKPDMRKKGVR
jgi:hypothetical protein